MSESKTFHILAPKPAKGRMNQFYGEGAPRVEKTLCGAAVTDHDNRFSWEPWDIADFVCCEACKIIRKQARKAVRS